MVTAQTILAYVMQFTSLMGIDVDTSKVANDQVMCLAQNIYYESKGESLEGQIAVASVTINRTKHSAYPNSICEVVKQHTVSNVTKKIACSFSWYCDRSKREIKFDSKNGQIDQRKIEEFQLASLIAIKALNGQLPDNTKGATHFHNDTVRPRWANEMVRTVRYDGHTFYRD